MKLPRDEQVGAGLVVVGLVALFLLMPGQFGPGQPPLRVLLGWGSIVAVIVLILGGLAVAFAPRLGWRVRWQAVVWGELLVLALLTLTHVGLADPLAAARAGRGSGLVGWALSQALAFLLPAPMAQALAVVWALSAGWLLWRALPVCWTAGVARVFPPGWLPALLSRLGRLLTNIYSALFCLRPGVETRSEEGRARESRGKGVGAPTKPAARGKGPAPVHPHSQTAGVKPSAGTRPAASSRAVAPPEPESRPTAAAKPAKETRDASAAAAGGRASRPGAKSPTGKPRLDTLPPLDLLRSDVDGALSRATTGAANADARQRGQILVQTLAEFNVPVEIVSIKEGPTVTQYGLEPGEIVKELRNGETIRRRVSVNSIIRLSNDLALALAAASIRIEAPVPGRPYVGVEIPNTAKTLVSLRGVLESREFAKIASPLAIGLGRDVSGDPVVVDLTRMPHLLIAGATGSGKSVCINAIVCSLLMNNGPETVRFVMVDPKMVELPGYNGIPHLLGPVITDPSQVPGALSWLMLQMDDRYRLFAANGARNIAEYNRKAARSKSLEPISYLILVIDELADLMMTAVYDIERQICRLAQMARATGIHLVLATQRPSVDVITGLIKANFPARIAFAVTSQVDSRVILDTPGAERLLGRGDMLLMVPESAKLARIQGCFVSDREIDALVDFWKASRAEADPADPAAAPWVGMADKMAEKDDLLEKALEVAQTKTYISTSLLQRQLRIGYPRAARLMEQLADMGAVGPDEGGGRSRQVLFKAAGPAGE
jgi:S-DNA-T family DNA segregation ATPase FtsK/SpoIIIE